MNDRIQNEQNNGLIQKLSWLRHPEAREKVLRSIGDHALWYKDICEQVHATTGVTPKSFDTWVRRNFGPYFSGGREKLQAYLEGLSSLGDVDMNIDPYVEFDEETLKKFLPHLPLRYRKFVELYGVERQSRSSVVIKMKISDDAFSAYLAETRRILSRLTVGKNPHARNFARPRKQDATAEINGLDGLRPFELTEPEVMKALAKLEPDERRAILMYKTGIGSENFAYVAQAEGIGVGEARRRVLRAWQKIQDHVDAALDKQAQATHENDDDSPHLEESHE